MKSLVKSNKNKKESSFEFPSAMFCASVLVLIFMLFLMFGIQDMKNLKASQYSLGSIDHKSKILDSDVQNKLQSYFPDIKIASSSYEPVTDLYMLRMADGMIMYTNELGTILIASINGQMTSIYSLIDGSVVNITEQLNRPINVKLLSDLKEGIVFKSDKERYRIKVFTDPQCSYCQKLHSEISEYNERGITVEYFAMPIFGDIPTDALARIWSLPLEQRALKLTQLKDFFSMQTGNLPNWHDLGLSNLKKESLEEVIRQKHIGLSLGFKGTPGIVLSNGQTINGYQSAENVLSHLKSMKPEE